MALRPTASCGVVERKQHKIGMGLEVVGRHTVVNAMWKPRRCGKRRHTGRSARTTTQHYFMVRLLPRQRKSTKGEAMIPTNELISMARECKLLVPSSAGTGPYGEALTAFAALVSTRAAAIERESCAKVCDSKIEYARFRQQEFAKDKMTLLAGMMQNTIDDTMDTAKKIRARGDQHE